MEQAPKRKKRRPAVTCGDNGGISRQTGKPCGNAPREGRKWCEFHRGNAPRGIAHYNYQGKGRGRYFPRDLAGQHRDLAKDPELVALREAIATAEMNSRRLISQLQGKISTRWDSAQETFKALEDAIRRGDADRLRVALAAHGQIVREENHDNWLWGKITEADERFMRLVMAERRYQIDSDELLSRERLQMLGEHVGERLSKAIVDDVDRWLGITPPSNPDATIKAFRVVPKVEIKAEVAPIELDDARRAHPGPPCMAEVHQWRSHHETRQQRMLLWRGQEGRVQTVPVNSEPMEQTRTHGTKEKKKESKAGGYVWG